MRPAFLDAVEFVSLPLPMGERPFRVRESVRYRSIVLDRVIHVPAGYRTDLASVPWFFRRIIPQSGRYNNAALIHDYLCDEDPKTCDHKQAARVFLEAMEVCGVGRIKRQAMYRAVLWCGPKFKPKDKP